MEEKERRTKGAKKYISKPRDLTGYLASGSELRDEVMLRVERRPIAL
jgi:hypothetical protein